MSRAKAYALLCLLLLSVFMRVEVTRLTEIDQPLRADARDYVLYAYNLVEFGIFSRDDRGITEGLLPAPDSARPPGYPVFMTPFIAVLGLDSSLVAIKWAQTVMSIAVVGLTFLLALECMKWWWAFMVTTLTAISPHLININVYWLTESLFTFLLVLGLYLLARLVRNPKSLSLALLFGLSFAYCAFTRQTVGLFLLPGLLLLYLHRRSDFPRNASIVLVMALLLPFVWGITYAPADGEGGGALLRSSIHHGIYPGFQYGDVAQSYGIPYRFDPRTAEIAASWPSLATEIGRRFSEEPARHLHWYFFGKPAAFLSWDIVQGQGGSYIYPVVESPYSSIPAFTYSHILSGLLHYPLVLLTLAACLLVWIATWRGWFPIESLFVPQLLSLLLLYFLAIHMVVAPFPRYAIPLRPASYLMAIWCCWAIWQRILPAITARYRHD